jgi:FkbM family methyltransferase
MKSPLKYAIRALAARRQQGIERRSIQRVHAILHGSSIKMLDVGAAGGILPRWLPYRADISFIGLEPDERSSTALLASPESAEYRSYRIIPSGAWSRRGPVGIAFTRKPMCSSHFQPNVPFLSRFPDAARFDVVGKGEVECQTLDDLLGGEEKADFIKLDLEGGELDVLRGSPRILAEVLGLHVEVAFHPLRLNQPLFGDVTAYLSDRGKEFIEFLFISRWERDGFRNLGQAVFADALYLVPPEAVSPERVRPYLAILLIYERYDLAVRLLDLLSASDDFRDREFLKQARGIVLNSKHSFDSRFRLSRKLGIAWGKLAAPNDSFHHHY